MAQTTSGYSLRYVLTTLLARDPSRTWTVGELVAMLDRHQIEVRGRPSKVVSDTLRSEISKGRVERVSRGHYRSGVAPPSTLRRIRSEARRYLEQAA